MASAGQVFENPVTGERMTFIRTGCDTNWMLLDIEFLIPPRCPQKLAAHVHPFFDERFEILEGEAHYQVGGIERAASAGDVLLLPRKVSHIHPWNVGDGLLRVRKITQLDRPQARLLLASAAFFESLYALAQQKKVKKNGLPKSPLQTIVLLQALEPSAYVASIPIIIQRPLFRILASIGRFLGYQADYIASSTPLEEIPEPRVGYEPQKERRMEFPPAEARPV